MIFADRADAGRRLAERLKDRAGESLAVLGLPRGGVVVALEVARALGAPLDLAVAKKIGHPQYPEAAIGAVSEDGQVVLNDAVEPIDPVWLSKETEAKLSEARALRRRLTGRGGIFSLEGKTAVLVDDGIATGQTMFAAVASVKKRGATSIIVAVPVGPPATLDRLREQVDEVIALAEPPDLYAVGAYFEDFRQVGDESVRKLLASA